MYGVCLRYSGFVFWDPPRSLATLLWLTSGIAAPPLSHGFKGGDGVMLSRRSGWENALDGVVMTLPSRDVDAFAFLMTSKRESKKPNPRTRMKTCQIMSRLPTRRQR